jgi:hypothetical protein
MQSDTPADTDFVKFWNSVLEPKFTRYRHIMQGWPSLSSAATFEIADDGKPWCVLRLDAELDLTNSPRLTVPQSGVFSNGSSQIL